MSGEWADGLTPSLFFTPTFTPAPNVSRSLASLFTPQINTEPPTSVFGMSLEGQVADDQQTCEPVWMTESLKVINLSDYDYDRLESVSPGVPLVVWLLHVSERWGLYQGQRGGG